MSKISKVWVTILAVAVLTQIIGCAASGPPFSGLPESKAGSGVLTIYRLKAFTGGGGYPLIYINNELVGTLKNGGFDYFRLPVGEYTIVLSNTYPTWTSKNQVWDVKIRERSELFYKVTVGASDNAWVESVMKNVALEELSNLRFSR